MNHYSLKKPLIALALLFGSISALQAQFSTDLSRQLHIPGIININSSETHFYALSESEGLIVFRAYSDSLQWLYSSTGMQERGHILESDIRFAYLYGNSRRLTIIEPTSVLGVYSSTILPASPLSVKRIGLRLFIAMGNSGLAMLNLETPESVDSNAEIITDNTTVLDLATDGRRTLYVLKNNQEISVYDVTEDGVDHQESVQVSRPLSRLFLANNELIGTDRNGNVFLVNSDGSSRTLAQMESPVEQIEMWDNQLIIRTDDQQLWAGSADGELTPWKTNTRGGNFVATSDNTLWLAEFNIIAPVIRSSDSDIRHSPLTGSTGEIKLKPISDAVAPSGRPIILPIEFEGQVDLSQIALSYAAPFDNARIRGKTFYWQPSPNLTGRQTVTITATSSDGRSDSVTFHIDVRPFNAPPRFTPTRPVSIPAGERFQLTISAVDPDGMEQNLIRYLGVDMPDGATINEQTGDFNWTPHLRQVGRHQFQIIATDQFGAAASQDFTINVIEIDETENDATDIF